MLSVYLDTQHISRIASQRSDLKAALDKSSASLFFSQTHVIESLPKNATPPTGEIARLQIIMSPSATGLVPWSDFPRKEFDSEKPSLQTFCCDIHDIMFPDEILFHRADWLKAARNAIKLELDQIPDLNVRRSQYAKLIKRGQLTSAGSQIFLQQLENTNESVSHDAPFILPILKDGAVYDFLAGKISERKFTGLFKKTVANPITLAEIINVPELAALFDISKFFWNQTDNLVTKLNEMTRDLVSVQVNTSEFDYKKIRRYIETESNLINFEIRLASSLVGKTVSIEKLNQMPGTQLYIKTLWKYCLDKIASHANIESPHFLKEVQFKRSDVADLNHLFYAPYMGIFGCDKATREIVRKTGSKVCNFASSDDEVKALLDSQVRRDNVVPLTTTSST
jgi:hypothetical protein